MNTLLSAPVVIAAIGAAIPVAVAGALKIGGEWAAHRDDCRQRLAELQASVAEILERMPGGRHAAEP